MIFELGIFFKLALWLESDFVFLFFCDDASKIVVLLIALKLNMPRRSRR